MSGKKTQDINVMMRGITWDGFTREQSQIFVKAPQIYVYNFILLIL
jgi:hypothetical protein